MATVIVDKVITDKLSIGSTFKTNITTNATSNLSLSLPSTNGGAKQCLTSVGDGTTVWRLAQDRVVLNTGQNATVGTGTLTSILPTQYLFPTGPTTYVSKFSANGNAISKQMYLNMALSGANFLSVSNVLATKRALAGTITSGTNAGGYLSSVILNNGLLMIAFVNGSTSHLTIMINSAIDGSGTWYTEVIDSTSVAIGTSITILANGCPAIAYMDKTTTNLFYAVNSRPDGLGVWTIHTVEATGTITSTSNNVSTTILSTGLPIIAYYHSSSATLKIAVNSAIDGSGVWTTTTIDSIGDTGRYPTIMLLSNGHPIISYASNTATSVKVAVSPSIDGTGSWSISTIDSINSNTSAISMCLLANNIPAIIYYKPVAPTGSIYPFFTYNSLATGLGSWNITQFNLSSQHDQFCSIGVMASGIPYINTYQPPSIVAYYNSQITGLGAWTESTLASPTVSGTIPTSSSIITLSNGYPAIMFYNGTTYLNTTPLNNVFFTFLAQVTCQILTLLKQ